MLSKLTSAPKLHATPQPLSTVVQSSVELFAPLCDQKEISFSYSVIDGLWAEIHEDSLQQILYNLLSNAYKYTPERGAISLKMNANGAVLSIVLTDTGDGFDASDMAVIFDRFQRSKQVNTQIFGVGIGLSVVNELIQAHDWQLSVKSKINQGSQFRVDIPLVAAPEQFDGELKLVDFSPEATPTDFKPPRQKTDNADEAKDGERLLIIEDNPDMQVYLDYLTEQQFTNQICGRGEDGIKTAIKNVPDIIICDLMLPDISGFDVVEELKRNHITAHIPILMLTAEADTQTKLAGLRRKVDDYLTKPFHYRELQLRLRNLLAGREAAQLKLKTRLRAEQAFNSERDGDLSAEDSVVVEFLRKLNVVVEKHYQNESFNLGQMAGQLGLSERQLQRKIRGMLSLTPGEYLREFRLTKAKRLLSTGIQVGLVADQVGFSSQAYFTKCFKEWHGETPSAFQKHSNST